MANVYLALDHDLDLFPVINKIDLPSADPDHVAAEIEDVIGLDASDAPRISAKTGINIDQVLEAVVHKVCLLYTSMQPFVVGKVMAQARAFTREQILSYVNLCVDAEESVKTGRLSERLAVELLIENPY